MESTAANQNKERDKEDIMCWPAPLIHLLNTTTRMLFEILFVMLIGAIVFLFALGIQCMHESEKTAKYSGSCIQLT